MKKYIGVKIVEAAPMNLLAFQKEFNRNVGYQGITDDSGDCEGYLVSYPQPDNQPSPYQAWSPKGIFEDAYRMTDGLTFGLAIEALKKGLKVARKGWNGAGQWVVAMPPLFLPPNNSDGQGAKVNERTAKHIGVGTPMDCQPYFVLWTAQQKWQPGWIPSTSDLLADDWTVVE